MQSRYSRSSVPQIHPRPPTPTGMSSSRGAGGRRGDNVRAGTLRRDLVRREIHGRSGVVGEDGMGTTLRTRRAMYIILSTRSVDSSGSQWKTIRSYLPPASAHSFQPYPSWTIPTTNAPRRSKSSARFLVSRNAVRPTPSRRGRSVNRAVSGCAATSGGMERLRAGAAAGAGRDCAGGAAVRAECSGVCAWACASVGVRASTCTDIDGARRRCCCCDLSSSISVSFPGTNTNPSRSPPSSLIQTWLDADAGYSRSTALRTCGLWLCFPEVEGRRAPALVLDVVRFRPDTG
jgi:hypothetical protein